MKKIEFVNYLCFPTLLLFMTAVTIGPNFVAAQDKYPLEAMVDGEISELSKEGKNFTSLDGSALIWQEVASKTGSDYLRFHFVNFSNPGSETFTLTIKDGQGKQVIEYNEDTVPGSDFWTPLVFGGRALIQVTADPVPQSLQFTLKEMAYQTNGGVWESIIDDDEREHIIDYKDDADITRVAKAVAKLSFFKDDFYVCTGFMINNNQLMTNHHCVATDEVCETTMVVFGYQLDENDNRVHGKQYACKKVVDANYKEDYSILELHGTPGDEWGTLAFSAVGLSDSQDLYIIQHPAGEPKQISKINCRVAGPKLDGRGTDTDFGHVCDTMGGSSGSPVLSEDHKVVGLHHFGVGQAQFWNKNRAVRAELIQDETE